MTIENKVPKLIDVILTAWTKSLHPPYGTGEYSSILDGMTDCNRFVYEVLANYGYKKFWDEKEKRPILANQMFDLLVSNGDWIEVSGDIAQFHANTGALVVAAWKNPSGEHGHVCMVRPGIAEASSTWGVTEPMIPKVANVSRPYLCRADRKASFAFSINSMPSYFVKKDMVP